MKTKYLLAASAIVAIVAAPAFAQIRVDTDVQTKATASLDGLHSSDSSQKPIRSVLVDGAINSDRAPEYINFDHRMTADGMIGKDVVDATGKKVAKVDDIVLNGSGQAVTIVLSEGGVLGLGDKLAGFDYSVMTRRDESGDVIMPMGNDLIERAMAFSYDPDDSSKDNTVVMPRDSRRVSEILDADLVDVEGHVIASVDNAAMRGGRIEYLIVGFGKTAGMGGKSAAIRTDSVSMIGQPDNIDFRLSADQVARFKALTETDLSSN